MTLVIETGREESLGVCGVQYVFASTEEKAKITAKNRFESLEALKERASQISMEIERIQRTYVWALWSRTALRTWDPDHRRVRSNKNRVIREVIEFHRYIK